MKISFAICTHNEGVYVKELLTSLTNFVIRMQQIGDPTQYEIIVVDDHSTDKITIDALNTLYNYSFASVYTHSLNNDYSSHKNFLNLKCTGDWIMNLDADEWLPDNVLELLPLIIESNPLVEAYWLPRINTVEGLTLAHVQKWNWVITTLDGFRQVRNIDKDSDEYKLLQSYDLIINEENGYVTHHIPIVNWPDFQMRLYKNDPKIYWKGKVHERLNGFEHFSHFPLEPEYAIRHYKDIKRQEQQNSYYETLGRS